MSDERGKKRKKKQYYKQTKQAKPGYKLSAGMRGFLITCNHDEKMALREAYSLLNEYADKLYGPEQVGENKDVGGDSSDSDEDLEATLKKEVQSLKEASKAVRRFQHVKTGGHNFLFIKTTLKDPVELVTTIMKDVYETKVAKSRHVMRFLPVCVTCNTVEEKILECAKQALAPYLSNPEGSTYSIIFKTRYNHSVNRSLIPKLGQVIKDLSTKNDVDLNTPDFAVLVNIIQGVCCLGVVGNFFKYSKYNLQAITLHRLKQEDEGEKLKSTDTSKDDTTVSSAEPIISGNDEETGLVEESPLQQEDEGEKLKSTDTNKDNTTVSSAEPIISGNDEETGLVEESPKLSDSRQEDANVTVEFASSPNNEDEGEKLKLTDTSKDDTIVSSAEPIISGNDKETGLVEESPKLSDSRQEYENVTVEFASSPNNETKTDLEANLAGASKESTEPSSSPNVETACAQNEERTLPKKDQNIKYN